MRILWVSPYAPYPPDTGGRQRVNHLLRAALEAGHQVQLLSVELRPADYPVPLPAGLTVHHFLARNRLSAARKTQALASPLPEIAWSLRAAPVVEALRHLQPGQVDLVVLEHAHAGGLLREVQRLDVPVVLDAHNVEWRVLRQAAAHATSRRRRLRFLVDAAKLFGLERHLLRSTDTTVAVSEADARLLRKMGAARPVVVESNGVDMEAIRWQDHAAVGERLLMTGHLGYVPNVDAGLWAAAEILPRLRARRPGLTLTLAGREPSPELAPALAAPGVLLRADPADISDCFADADVFFAPLRVGSGTRIKVLEALAAGVVVVGTRRALEGLDVEARGLALSGETPSELAAGVERALTDADLRARVAAEGRTFVAEHHDWREIGRAFERRLREVDQRRRVSSQSSS
jgi:glycosyltransferase involved in cell wall biosynthesis